MYSIAVVGDKDSIYGFSALGLDVYPSAPGEEAEKILKKLCHGNYSVIFITEAVASSVEDIIEKYSYSKTPAIILIPGIKGNTGNGIAAVKKSVEKAVGSDIIFND